MLEKQLRTNLLFLRRDGPPAGGIKKPKERLELKRMRENSISIWILWLQKLVISGQN